MYDLAVVITGDADITYENAKVLLDDFLPENCRVLVPNYVTAQGMKNVIKWLEDYGVPFERVKSDKLGATLHELEASRKAVLILGAEYVPENTMYPLYDLSRALFMLSAGNEPQMPLDGPESHAETVSDVPDGSVRVEDSEPHSDSQSLALDQLEGLNERQRREVEEIIMTFVRTREFGWTVQETPDPQPVIKLAAPEPEMVDGKIKYYVNKSGKYRKAGNSKPRPGETEAWLTQEEADAL